MDFSTFARCALFLEGVAACINTQTRAHHGLRRPRHGRRVATRLAPADRRHRKPGDQLSQLLAPPLARVGPGLPSRFLKAYLMLRASSPYASTLHSFGLIRACYPCMQICSVAAVDARWNRWQKHAEKTNGSTGVGRTCTESRKSNGTALFDALVNVIRIRMYVWRVCVSMCLCVCVCVCVSVYVCMGGCVHLYSCRHTYIYRCITNTYA